MTVPQYPPKRPPHPGESHQIPISRRGDSRIARIFRPTQRNKCSRRGGASTRPPMPQASEKPPHCGKRNVEDAVPYIQIHPVGNGPRAVPRFCCAVDWNGPQVFPYKQKTHTSVCEQKKKDILSDVLVLALAIFTARHQATIVGVSELNFCVRDGNRWTLTTINTNSLRIGF